MLSEKDRIQSGRSEAKRLSLEELGQFEPAKKRTDPIEILKRAEKGRLPKLLPVKYGRMLPSAFGFFRGSVGIMAHDLASQPHTKLFAQLCGDAHLQNLGCFGSPDGRVIFDINDFDETAWGPWEWDVKRMATSIILAGLECKHTEASCEQAVTDFTESYTGLIAELADQPTLLAARHVIHRLSKVESLSAAFAQAQRSTPGDLLKKYAEKGKKHYKLKRTPSFWPVSKKEAATVLTSLDAYKRTLPLDRLHFLNFYEPVDVGFKIVGTGSVALRDFVVLMEGRIPEDALFIQIKQEVLSTYSPYLKLKRFTNQGARVVEGQHRIQSLSDLLLGWTTMGKYDFLVRQLNDHKGGIAIENMKGNGLSSLARVAGELLARGHARSGDALEIQAYLTAGKGIEKSIRNFAHDYAKQVGHDYLLFKDAVASGRLKAIHEPEK